MREIYKWQNNLYFASLQLFESPVMMMLVLTKQLETGATIGGNWCLFVNNTVVEFPFFSQVEDITQRKFYNKVKREIKQLVALKEFW